MKKYTLIKILMIVGIGNNAISQNATDTISLKNIEIPNSPAFILLDQTPSTIERPTSTKAFALSILNAFQANNGFPKNYAADFTPFWFFKHPNMTSLKYAGYNVAKEKQRIFGNIERASFSVAFITTTDTLTQKSVNNVSFGLRFNLISIRRKKDIDDIKSANSNLIKFMQSRDDRLQKYLHDPTLSVTNPVLYHMKVKEFFEQDEESKKADENSLKDILARKPVFAIDGALGYNTFFLDSKYSDNHFGRFGAWLTLNYSQHLVKDGGNYLNLYAIGRYVSDGTMIENGKYRNVNNYDFGGKLEFEFKKISIAYEYVHRVNDISDSYRSNGLVKYKISEQLYLTGAVGKNFGTSNNLISILGINWGLSTGNEKSTVKE